MKTPYVLACLKSGTIQGFDADDMPIFESKYRLSHYSTTQNEWLFLLIVAAKRAGIEIVEFVRNGSVEKITSVTELVSQLNAYLME